MRREPHGAEHAVTGRPPSATAADAALVQGVLREVARRIVGQEPLVERLLICLLTGGHVLLEGVPGLAKTLTVRTLAETVRSTFQRIQFTPDLLPADVVGTQLYDQASGSFRIKHGPVFRSPSAAPPSCSPSRSSSSPPRIRSSRRGPIRSPRRRSTGS
jgi:hypothetical protein